MTPTQHFGVPLSLSIESRYFILKWTIYKAYVCVYIYENVKCEKAEKVKKNEGRKCRLRQAENRKWHMTFTWTIYCPEKRNCIEMIEKEKNQRNKVLQMVERKIVLEVTLAGIPFYIICFFCCRCLRW